MRFRNALPDHLGWQLGSLGAACIVVLPLLTLVWLSFGVEAQVWQHLTSTVLPDYVIGSLELMVGVALLSALLGISSAWLITQYQFVGANWLKWALLLPLAMPAYITAYSYTGLLDAAGPVQGWLRESYHLQYGEYWFPEIRSVGGAIAVLSFVLYPYIYMMVRASLLEQSQRLSDVSRTLGCSRWRSFCRVSLPIARPAIFASLALVMMETLADFGTVSYFGVSTFTTGIFRTWYGLDSLHSAAQLSLTLVGFVVVLLWIEKASRRRGSYFQSQQQCSTTIKLRGFKSWAAFGLAFLPLLFGFIVPVWQLLIWSVANYGQLLTSEFWLLLEHTFLAAGMAAVLAVLLAVVILYGYRLTQSTVVLFARRVAGLGYAIPGMVIAIGILVPLATLDKSINHWMQANFDVRTGLLLSGTVVALVVAYIVRFLAVSLNAVESGMNRIHPNFDHSAQLLGASPSKIMLKIHFPLMRASLLTALLLVFVEVMKELPATLVLRPFNFNTLSVRAYELASDERLADAALPSLAIVLVSLIPVVLMTRAINKK